MVRVSWQVPGTHLPSGKTPGTEPKWVKEGRIPDPQTRQQVKTVTASQWEGWAEVPSCRLREGRFSCPRWRPGSVLFRQQGSCFMMGTVPAHRVSVKASSLKQPGSPSPKLLLATRALGHPRKRPSPPPPPTTFSCARPRTHSRWRCNQEQNPINPKTGQVRGKSHFVSYPPRVTRPSALRGAEFPAACGPGEVEGLRNRV